MEIIYPNHRENRLVFVGQTHEGKLLDQNHMQRMFELSGESIYDNEQDRNETQALSEKLKALCAMEEQDKIDLERNRLIDETKKKLTQKVNSKHIFTLIWRVK